MAVANFGSNSVSIFRNTSTSGSISFAARVDFATGINPRGVNIGDFDGDGKPDLAIAHGGNNFMSVLRNNSTSGSIAFQAKVDFALSGGNSSTFVNSGDLDGDGKLDIVVANYALSTVSVFRNTATSGTIDASSFAAKVDFATGIFPFSVSIGDFDGDNKPDLATANLNDNTISVLRNTASSGSINASSFAAKVDFAAGAGTISSNVGDIDGDGKLDLLGTNYDASTLSILRNTATSGSISAGSFNSRINYPTFTGISSGTGPRFVCIGDLDGDGKPDMAVVSNITNTVSIIHNPFISIPTNLAGPGSICSNSTATLSATCVAGTTPTWYSASSSTTSVFSGSPFVTPPIAASTYYTVSCKQGSNSSPVVSIYTDIKPSPAAPTITASGATTFCSGGSVTLNSNVGNNNALSFVKTSSQ